MYFGFDTDGLVVTDRAPLTEEQRGELVAELGEAAVLSAEALQARAVDEELERELFLCHAFCEIGAVRLVDELERVNSFLDDHPREVVVIVVQDEGPRGADIAEAFAASGLIDKVHTQPLDEPWPTLSEMIERNERVFVLAENEPGAVAWYHDAFAYIRDTPFKFESAEDFTCDRNRGTPESPLLLVNHWLSPVSATAADEVNAAEILRARIADCASAGFPNLIAVDFADRGDLLQAVDEVNGIQSPAS